MRSLSGEFCQADGSFTLQRPEGNAAPLSNGPCTVLNKLVCVRWGRGVGRCKAGGRDMAAPQPFLMQLQAGQEAPHLCQSVSRARGSLAGGAPQESWCSAASNSTLSLAFDCRLSSSMDAAAESAFLAISENQFGGKEIAPAAELIAEVADSLPGGRKLLGK